MKLYNILVDGKVHLAAEGGRGLIDLTAAGYEADMDSLIRGACRGEITKLLADDSLPVVAEPVYANIMNKVGKLVCVGLNYKVFINPFGDELVLVLFVIAFIEPSGNLIAVNFLLSKACK